MIRGIFIQLLLHLLKALADEIDEEMLFSGVTVQAALKENSIETAEENLLQLKYDPESVWGYVEVHGLSQPPNTRTARNIHFAIWYVIAHFAIIDGVSGSH